MAPVIKAEHLTKKYIIGHQQAENYTALRDVIADSAKRLGRRLLNPFRRQENPSPAFEAFLALDDVSFEINEGERIGVIGRNGAGKSTLLKVLSRITEPTRGKVSIKGRVASLLEVGTGFHPELTGRENIYLNGAILGMSKADIKKNFDEIVAFAEVERFLDTPVKRYSSGMYVRLAFSVAAHLEPDILIVDEVLAVGDAQFQKKCLGKMETVGKGGRTVLFVSHNMSAIETLCSKAMLLEKGRVSSYSNNVASVINQYFAGAGGGGQSSGVWVNDGNSFDHPVISPAYLAITDGQGLVFDRPVPNDQPYYVTVRVNVKKPDPAIMIGFRLLDAESKIIFYSFSTDSPEENWPQLDKGLVDLCCQLPNRLLNEGSYSLELILCLRNREWIIHPDHTPPIVSFSISGGMSDSPYWGERRAGCLAPNLIWERSK